MKLYLVRHGQALDSRIDPARPLSDAGREEARKLAAYVRFLGIEASAVWHSGKTRAQQTAEILAEEGGLEGAPIKKNGLAPNDPVETLALELNARGEEGVLVVGHLPFVANLTAHLISSGADSEGRWAFETSATLCIERDELQRWWVRWFLGPSALPPI